MGRRRLDFGERWGRRTGVLRGRGRVSLPPKGRCNSARMRNMAYILEKNFIHLYIYIYTFRKSQNQSISICLTPSKTYCLYVGKFLPAMAGGGPIPASGCSQYSQEWSICFATARPPSLSSAMTNILFIFEKIPDMSRNDESSCASVVMRHMLYKI